jgi:hypothetical protein
VGEVDEGEQEARRRRAEEMRRAIEDVRRGRRRGRPPSPRELTNERAAEAARDRDQRGEGEEDDA